MGNTASSSGKHSQGHNIRDETVDFGHLSPQGIYTGPQDWNQQIVGKLIIDRKLAPFYRPLEDYEPDWDDETILRNRKVKPGEEALPPPVTMQVFGPAAASGRSSVKGKGVADRREPTRMSEVEVYRGATECPICFLYYPPNINRSRCCDQAICTECFVQIKRSEPTATHLVSEPAACPYCVQDNFGVTYEPPNWRSGLVMNNSGSSRPELSRLTGSAVSSSSTDSQGILTSERARRKSVPHQAGEVVTIDLIRPDWEAKLEAVRAAVARRANRRIVMRQVGDRLIPVGITSGRVVPMPGAEGTETSGSGRRSRRQRNGASGELPMGMTGHDLEELMMMEAMRLSLLEHEAQQQREREAAARNATLNPDVVSPPRESSNASPDPASQLPQEDSPQSTQAQALHPPPNITSRSGSSTPLHPSPSRVSEPGSDRSSVVSPRPSFDTSQPTSSHHRTGSAANHVASSPLNGAAALAMAVGFPTPPSQSGAPSEPAEGGQLGFYPRTLNTLSAAVSASSIPAAILGSGPIDRSVTGGTTEDSAPVQGSAKTVQEPLHNVLPSSAVAPSIEHQDESVAAITSHSDEDRADNTTPQPGLGAAPQSSIPTSKSTIDSISSLPNPFDPPAVKFTVDDVSASSPVAPRDPDSGNQPSAAFLSPAARTTTADSIVSTDSRQTKGENYDVLLSSSETETDEPLMARPPNLARLDTADSYSAGGSAA